MSIALSGPLKTQFTGTSTSTTIIDTHVRSVRRAGLYLSSVQLFKHVATLSLPGGALTRQSSGRFLAPIIDFLSVNLRTRTKSVSAASQIRERPSGGFGDAAELIKSNK